MTDTMKGVIIGALLTSILGGLGWIITHNIQRTEAENDRDSAKIEKQTDAERENMQKLAKSLETMHVALDAGHEAQFATLADQFITEYDTHEFSTFLEKKDTVGNRDDVVNDEVRSIRQMLYHYREERRKAGCDVAKPPTDPRCRCPLSLFVSQPIEILAEQLRRRFNAAPTVLN